VIQANAAWTIATQSNHILVWLDVEEAFLARARLLCHQCFWCWWLSFGTNLMLLLFVKVFGAVKFARTKKTLLLGFVE
jgi:hypothetical protein